MDGNGDGFLSEDILHGVVGRALLDPAYRAKLTNRENPEDQIGALRDMGVENPEAKLEKLNTAIDAVKDLFGDNKGQDVAGVVYAS